MTLLNKLAKKNNLAEDLITVISHKKISSDDPNDFVSFSGFDKSDKNKMAFLELSKDPDVARVQMCFVKNKANQFFMKNNLNYFVEINKKLNREFDDRLLNGDVFAMIYIYKPDLILSKHFFSDELKKIAHSRGHFSGVTKNGNYFLFTTTPPESAEEREKFVLFSDKRPNFREADAEQNPKEIEGKLYIRANPFKNLHKMFECKNIVAGKRYMEAQRNREAFEKLIRLEGKSCDVEDALDNLLVDLTAEEMKKQLNSEKVGDNIRRILSEERKKNREDSLTKTKDWFDEYA